MAAGGGPREPKATQVQPKWPQQEAEPEQPSVYSLMYAAVDSLQPKQHTNRRGLGGRAAKQEPGHRVQSVPWAWKPMGRSFVATVGTLSASSGPSTGSCRVEGRTEA